MSGTVLVAATTWWPAPARLAMAFRRSGLRAQAICPRGHPLRHTRAITHCSNYAFHRPVSALRDAIVATQPDLIVPCDDRAVHHLHRIHDEDGGGGLARIIAASLGAGAHFRLVESRHALLRLAAAEGMRMPPSAQIRSEADFDRWDEPFPWVIKRGMSWGGAGVLVVRSRKDAESAFRAMARPIGIGRAVKRLIVNGDGFSLAPSLARIAPEVIVQGFIDGQPASVAMACHQGEMLAHLSVRALATQGATGASTVVEVIDRPDMTAAAERLAARLHLSGFHGLDFLLDKTGAAWLIELNPRATQVCHVPIGGGPSLAEVLAATLTDVRISRVAKAPIGTAIAFFPQAWYGDPENPLLRSASHDVPWDEPRLVKELMAPPWPNRGFLARTWQHLLDPRGGQDGWVGSAPVPPLEAAPTSATTDLPHRCDYGTDPNGSEVSI